MEFLGNHEIKVWEGVWTGEALDGEKMSDGGSSPGSIVLQDSRRILHKAAHARLVSYPCGEILGPHRPDSRFRASTGPKRRKPPFLLFFMPPLLSMHTNKLVYISKGMVPTISAEIDEILELFEFLALRRVSTPSDTM